MDAITNINKTQDDIIDIQIKGIGKKRIRVNGDNSKIITINPNDTKVLERLTTGYPKYMEWHNEYIKTLEKKEAISDTSTLEYWKEIAEVLSTIDNKLRELINYIFNVDISSVLDDDGSMCDVLETGETRFDTILFEFLQFYGDNIANNFKKMKERSQSHTDKYVKK